MFLDEAKIYVQAGDGGAGLVAFRREKYVPHGGPAGGDGGKGGGVWLVVNTRLSTLASFQRKRHFKAAPGGRGGNFDKTGRSGDDLLIEVPPGTVVRDATGRILADLVRAGQRVRVARGGRGGRGNARFATPTNQAPRIAEKGEPGEERWLLLELKLIAEVGIVGVPNAGKSTFLSVVSAARPKIAPYPFTTLTPNLGMVVLDDRDVVMADIPGLVEGAHMGVGLGHSFLRHIQRTRVLIHLLNGAGQDPVGDFVQINAELALFDPALAEKPQLVALNKIDLPQAQACWPEVRDAIRALGYQVFAISALTRQGVREVLNSVLLTLSELPPEPPPSVEVPVFRPEEDKGAFHIEREGPDRWRVTGERIERAAAMTYWEYDEAVQRFQGILKALGIQAALEKAGVQVGDTVYIGDYELEWTE
jgi:GTP-binding protein